ncbi:MAG: hypothetical protein MI757_00395, partial [Pirellulales bacterium]|nr:hypothetical protein [Pirellulales bacterium]
EDWLYGKHELTTTWSVVADTTMSAPITSDLAERADRGDRKKFERALRKVKDRTPRPEDQA